MRFLIDAQLPPTLIKIFENAKLTAEHVSQVGLETSEDEVLWEYAFLKNFVIITKDEDFSNLQQIQEKKVAVVWVRIGNCSNRDLIEKIKKLLPEIVERLNNKERLVEII